MLNFEEKDSEGEQKLRVTRFLGSCSELLIELVGFKRGVERTHKKERRGSDPDLFQGKKALRFFNPDFSLGF